jgi:hypothetical protein
MTKIKRWIRNWLSDSNQIVSSRREQLMGINTKQLESQGFQLKIFSANGGTIVETEKFDRKADMFMRSMYIVTDEKTLGDELAKIITMEQLR